MTISLKWPWLLSRLIKLKSGTISKNFRSSSFSLLVEKNKEPFLSSTSTWYSLSSSTTWFSGGKKKCILKRTIQEHRHIFWDAIFEHFWEDCFTQWEDTSWPSLLESFQWHPNSDLNTTSLHGLHNLASAYFSGPLSSPRASHRYLLVTLAFLWGPDYTNLLPPCAFIPDRLPWRCSLWSSLYASLTLKSLLKYHSHKKATCDHPL